MLGGSDARRRIGEARAFDAADEFHQVFGLYRAVHRENRRRARGERDGRELDDRIDGLFRRARIHGDGRRGHEQRVTVGLRCDDQLRGQHSAGSAAVLDHDGLTDPVREFLTDGARYGVCYPARRERNHEANRFGRERLLRQYRAGKQCRDGA